MDVLSCAWVANGAPPAPNASQWGRCARCSRAAALTATRQVVSKAFTALDQWAEPAGFGLCATCSWSYTTPMLRSQPHLVTQHPTMTVLGLAQVYQLLASQPLEPTTALVVPLRPGRKHLLPQATWGRVTIDNIALPWSVGEVWLLGLVGQLRRLGFGSQMIAQPAPAWPVLRRHPQNLWPDIQSAWSELNPWRPQSPWLELALHLAPHITPQGHQ